jgi:hypothetical protein
MKQPSKAILRSSLIALCCTWLSCTVAKDIQQAMTNLSRCKFKLDSVSGFTLAGVQLAGKSNINFSDGATLLAAFAQNELPASFTLGVAAINPNDGTGGTAKASATLIRFPWTLIIDNTLTIQGDIPSQVVIPGTGQQSMIPLNIQLDLAKFFKDKGYEHMINLALALGGASHSPSRITLRARPTLNTDFGPMTYPGELDIVDKEFR